MIRILSFLFLLALTACVPQRVQQPPRMYEEAPVSTKKLVVIDAGHGGKDEGTIAGVYEEKALALSTAKLVQKYLKSLGYRVVMTRERDVFVPLDERVAIANDVGAEVFVSVHYNHAASKKASGIEVYYCDEKTARSRESKALAQCVLDEVLTYTDAKSRGVKTANYRVIRKTDMPAILVEGGFLSNVEEKKRIISTSYQESLAQGIAKGVDNFLK